MVAFRCWKLSQSGFGTMETHIRILNSTDTQMKDRAVQSDPSYQ